MSQRGKRASCTKEADYPVLRINTAAGLADGQEFQPLVLFVHLGKKIDTSYLPCGRHCFEEPENNERQCLYYYVTQSRRNGKENIKT